MKSVGETEAGEDPRNPFRPRHVDDRVSEAGTGREPCLRCGVSLPVRLMGCQGGHCPNCRHPYPHGDCSD